MDKPFQESHEDIGGKFPLDNHESKDATRGDSRDHIAAEAGSGCGNDGCFAANSPCLARMKVGTHSCLVTKENVRLMLARQSTNLRKLLFYPLLNTFVVLLKSTPKRFLRAKPQLVQQPTYRCFAEAYAVLAPDQFAYHDRRPQGERELHLSWVFHCHGIINPLQHLGGQFWWAATALTSVQSVPTSPAIPSQPAEQGRSLHAKHLRHYHYRLPILYGGYSPFSQFCKFIKCKLSSICISHA